MKLILYAFFPFLNKFLNYFSILEKLTTKNYIKACKKKCTFFFCLSLQYDST